MKMTEQFKRVADDIVQYQFTVDDPVTYARPFTISMPLTPLDGGVLLPYECHEGNLAVATRSAPNAPRTRRSPRTSRRGSSARGVRVQESGAGAGGGGRGALERRRSRCAAAEGDLDDAD